MTSLTAFYVWAGFTNTTCEWIAQETHAVLYIVLHLCIQRANSFNWKNIHTGHRQTQASSTFLIAHAACSTQQCSSVGGTVDELEVAAAVLVA